MRFCLYFLLWLYPVATTDTKDSVLNSFIIKQLGENLYFNINTSKKPSELSVITDRMGASAFITRQEIGDARLTSVMEIKTGEFWKLRSSDNKIILQPPSKGVNDEFEIVQRPSKKGFKIIVGKDKCLTVHTIFKSLKFVKCDPSNQSQLFETITLKELLGSGNDSDRILAMKWIDGKGDDSLSETKRPNSFRKDGNSSDDNFEKNEKDNVSLKISMSDKDSDDLHFNKGTSHENCIKCMIRDQERIVLDIKKGLDDQAHKLQELQKIEIVDREMKRDKLMDKIIKLDEGVLEEENHDGHPCLSNSNYFQNKYKKSR